MAKKTITIDDGTEPSESGMGLGSALGLLGLGAAGSAAFGGGAGAFKPKAGQQTTQMGPGKQALLQFMLDLFLRRLGQTGGVNQSFASYLKQGPQRMAPPSPEEVALLKQAISQPGAFDTTQTIKPPRPSTFQDVASLLGVVGALGGQSRGGLGGLLESAAGTGRGIYDKLSGAGGTDAALLQALLSGGGSGFGMNAGQGAGAQLAADIGANPGGYDFSVLGGGAGGAPASGGFPWF